MTNTEIYSLLATDTLSANLAINLDHEIIYPAMTIAGDYNPIATFSIAIIAAACGYIFDYFLGWIARKIVRYASPRKDIPKIVVGLVLVATQPINATKFVVLSLGLVGYNFPAIILMSIFSKGLYYIALTLPWFESMTNFWRSLG